MATLFQRAEEIRSKVVIEGECWVYPTERRAYLTVFGKMELVYRIMYQACVGPIPAGKSLLHSCDNGKCCNPLHLQIGEQRVNVLQAVERGLVMSKSPLPGVSWQSTRKRWLVMPRIDGVKVTLYAGKDFFEAACCLKSFHAALKSTGITTE